MSDKSKNGMEIKKVRRPGSGRTPGSISFKLVKLSDLTKMFGKRSKQPIMVSRKWADVVGVRGRKTKPVGQMH